MNIAKQGVAFILVGLLQLGVDTLVYVLLDQVTGMPGWSNFLGRLSGAFLGFFLNAKFTFATLNDSKSEVTRSRPKQQFLRFITAWILLTIVSTYLVTSVHHNFSSQMSYLAKPVIEGTLAIVSFFISRQWIYR